MEHPQSSSKLALWWKNLGKKGKINFFLRIAFWLLAIAFFVFVLFGESFGISLGKCLKLSVPISGGWEDIWPRIVGSLFYLFFILGVSRVLQFILLHLPTTSRKAATMLKLIASFIKYAGLIVTILMIIAVWGVDSNSLLLSAGIIGLIIGLGAQSLISDIIAGLNIVFEDEYKVGDIVVVDDFRGTIQEIGLTTTKIIDPAGNVKIINNSQISTVVNLSDHPSIASCLMYIDYDEDLVRVENLLRDNAADIKKQCPHALDLPTYLGVSGLQDGYIELKMICHCKEEDRFQTERDLNRAYCLLFLNSGIDYPYNQLMIGSRALTHPQDAADPEQLKRFFAKMAGDSAPKAEKKSVHASEEPASKPFDTPRPVEPSPYLEDAKPVAQASKEAQKVENTVLPKTPEK
ncbi:MAG: putative MscS family protein YkuT [Tenericutes bacterium ADurb.BinA155]|jgi:small-conductance mechanosensitive channel|nr:MAG: putative MscS family protein YkuT [Tenericutes bacterium ADurb.BinA155]